MYTERAGDAISMVPVIRDRTEREFFYWNNQISFAAIAGDFQIGSTFSFQFNRPAIITGVILSAQRFNGGDNFEALDCQFNLQNLSNNGDELPGFFQTVGSAGSITSKSILFPVGSPVYVPVRIPVNPVLTTINLAAFKNTFALNDFGAFSFGLYWKYLSF